MFVNNVHCPKYHYQFHDHVCAFSAFFRVNNVKCLGRLNSIYFAPRRPMLKSKRCLRSWNRRKKTSMEKISYLSDWIELWFPYILEIHNEHSIRRRLKRSGTIEKRRAIKSQIWFHLHFLYLYFLYFKLWDQNCLGGF